MKVGEMVDLLRMPKVIEFRDSNNNMICITSSDSQGVKPYREKDVDQWFPFIKQLQIGTNADICILLKEE